MLLSLNGNFVPHVTARCEDWMDFASYSLALIAAFATARYVTENTKIHLKFKGLWIHHWILAGSGDGCYVLLEDRRAILVGRINRYRIGGFAKEKLVYKAQKVRMLD